MSEDGALYMLGSLVLQLPQCKGSQYSEAIKSLQQVRFKMRHILIWSTGGCFTTRSIARFVKYRWIAGVLCIANIEKTVQTSRIQFCRKPCIAILDNLSDAFHAIQAPNQRDVTLGRWSIYPLSVSGVTPTFPQNLPLPPPPHSCRALVGAITRSLTSCMTPSMSQHHAGNHAPPLRFLSKKSQDTRVCASNKL